MVSIKDLKFRYSKRQSPLFEELSFELPSGSIVGLLGKNGAGKTSLLKLMVGLLKPTEGSVRILDQQPSARQASLLQEIYFLPEEFHQPSISIRKFVKANAGFYPRFDKELLKRLLADFELPDNKQLNQFSYGQKKKFLIAFALSTKCRLLVFDEPTNGLDIPSKAIFRRVMAGSLDEDQLVIISTHQVRDVENLIDRVLMLEQGKFIMQKDLHDIASKLQFATTSTPHGENVLYHEMVPGGYKVITPQTDGSSSVDIELLFNAISNGSEKLKEYVK
ncbi:ABC transporter ATP-binding protein [Chryseotalea sanaruensis]|uniref:ABC transporter ATP-binding protein n=1 Tax=Chryseotalea sanaruensis TaxID=2482724 RepID=A0A401U666_9BACT|nr:ABC transporter ATP-binding protein [Chryseotalea sanaruensis]GCC50428.1 ABC transporter ATP-binding protein [Chryseotalea sanaruensis]